MDDPEKQESKSVLKRPHENNSDSTADDNSTTSESEARNHRVTRRKTLHNSSHDDDFITPLVNNHPLEDDPTLPSVNNRSPEDEVALPLVNNNLNEDDSTPLVDNNSPHEDNPTLSLVDNSLPEENLIPLLPRNNSHADYPTPTSLAGLALLGDIVEEVRGIWNPVAQHNDTILTLEAEIERFLVNNISHEDGLTRTSPAVLTVTDDLVQEDGEAFDLAPQQNDTILTPEAEIDPLLVDTSLGWKSLPPEIRQLILDKIYADAGHNKRRSLLATVSLEWRDYFERRNFYHLELTSDSDLDRLKLGSGISPRHIPMVWGISLEISLAKYNCRSCCDSGSDHWMVQCSGIFREALIKLFTALATWGQPPAQCYPPLSERSRGPGVGGSPWSGVVLKLSAYTPSDQVHFFRNFEFGHGILSEWQNYRELDRDFGDLHGWVHGNQVDPPKRGAILRLFSPLCRTLPTAPPRPPKQKPRQIGSKEKLTGDSSSYSRDDTNDRSGNSEEVADTTNITGPVTTSTAVAATETATDASIETNYCPQAPIVTGLKITRQTRRYIPSSIMASIWSCLPNLECVIYEPWRIGRFVSRDWDPRMATLVRGLPQEVRHLTVFEDFNDSLTAALVTDGSHGRRRGCIGLPRPPFERVTDQEREFLGITSTARDNHVSIHNANAGENQRVDNDSDSDIQTDTDTESDTESDPNLALASAFVHVSRRLEILSVSYMIDARDFFAIANSRHSPTPKPESNKKRGRKGPARKKATVKAGSIFGGGGGESSTLNLRGRVVRRRNVLDKWRPGLDNEDEKQTENGNRKSRKKKWPILQDLILTSPIMSNKTRKDEVLALLKEAARAARNMPQLRSLIIWHCGSKLAPKVQAAAFKYTTWDIGEGIGQLEWHGTWALELTEKERDELFSLWEEVAARSRKVIHGGCGKRGVYLRDFYEFPTIEEERIKNHGDAVKWLSLPPYKVIDPFSAASIRKEED